MLSDPLDNQTSLPTKTPSVGPIARASECYRARIISEKDDTECLLYEEMGTDSNRHMGELISYFKAFCYTGTTGKHYRPPDSAGPHDGH